MNISLTSPIYSPEKMNIDQLPNKNLRNNKKILSTSQLTQIFLENTVLQSDPCIEPDPSSIRYNKKGQIIKPRAKKNMYKDWKKHVIHFMLNPADLDANNEKISKLKSINKKKRKNEENIQILDKNLFGQIELEQNQMQPIMEENIEIFNQYSLDNDQTEETQIIMEPPLTNDQTHLLHPNIIQEFVNSIQNNPSLMQTILNYTSVFLANQNSRYINNQMDTNHIHSFETENFANENTTQVNSSEDNFFNYIQEQNFDYSNLVDSNQIYTNNNNSFETQNFLNESSTQVNNSEDNFLNDTQEKNHSKNNEHSNSNKPKNQKFYFHNYFYNTNTQTISISTLRQN